MNYAHLGEDFNKTFSHHISTVNGFKQHYVIGGNGDSLILLHGFPQTWYAFRHILLRLAKDYTVIVPDLRGLGDSEKPGFGYDTVTAANDIYQLVQQLGCKAIFLLGHDLGANVAYAYAANHREEVKKLIFLDAGILDSKMEQMPLLSREARSLWWFTFHQVAQLPEKLVAGREEDYLAWFFENLSFNKAAFTAEDLKEYSRTYALPGTMKAGFDYYRALFTSIDANKQYSEIKLEMPVLAVGGEYSFGLRTAESWKTAANHVTAAVIEDSGHYIPDEQPSLLVKTLLSFLADR